MKVIRNSILAGIASIVLPMSGFAHHTAQFLVNLRNSLSEIAQSVPVRSSDFVEPGIRIRSDAHTSAPVRGLGSPGHRATVHERTPGQNIVCPGGQSSNEWARITDRRTGITGYVSACYL